MLIQPPHYYEGGSRWPESFPLGLAYLGRALLDAGHEVEVLNIWQYQWSNEQVVEELGKRDFDVVGITALSTQYNYVKWLSSVLKARFNAKIILGGALATFNASLVLDLTDVDYCVVGEGERRLVQLLNDGLPNNKAVYQGQDVVDLDTLPFPAWHLFDVDFYLKPKGYYGAKPLRSMNVITSRGCPYHCRFCSKVFQSVRLRSVGNIVEEIKVLQDRYGVECVKFDDELVMVSKKRMMDLCDALEPLNIHFVCQGRTNIVDCELLERMKKAGCIAVGYGVESGSQRILDNMDKQTTVGESKSAVLNTLSAGIYPVVQMMFGYPGEDYESLNETVEFFRNIPFLSGRVHLAITTALPGAELYQDCLTNKLIVDEEEYLEKLDAGYLRFGGKMLLNFTRFSNEEFVKLRDWADTRIFWMQVLHHPFSFVKVMVKRVWNKLRTLLCERT